MKTLIKVKALSKYFGNQQILDKVSFDIFEGEILIIVGSSGVGKTTLLNCLSKLDLSYEGMIGYDERIFKEIDVPLPIVFQDFDQLLPWYNIEKNVLLPYKRKTLSEKDRGLLTFVGLEKDLHKRPTALSGGMKQRAAIARSLMSDSKIIFMDEPFASLDADRREKLQDLILKINKDYNRTIVFITHDLDEAQRLGHRILKLTAHGMIEIK